MFLKTTVSRAGDGSKLRYYTIVKSVRRDGIPRHEALHYLGALTAEEAQGIRNALQAAKNPGSVFVDPSTISAQKHYGFLHLMVLHWIYMSLALHQLLGRVRHAELLVLNRAVDPTSKAGVFEWAPGTACPAFLGVPRAEEIAYDIYRDLDRLAKMQNRIMAHLYSELRRRGKTADPRFIYDITATYMEGTKCVIAEYGYAPGGKRGHKQIKIALGVTKDGYPFYWKVLKGKTSDKTTVTKVIAEMRELFQIADCTFVFDRGMATFDNFHFVEANGCTYLSALNSDTVRSMRFPGVSALSSITVEDAQALADQLDEDAGLARIPKELSGFTLYDEGKSFYKTIAAGGERYILVFNPELLVTRRQDREARIAKAEAEIGEINKDAMAAKKSRAPEPMLAKAKAILSRLSLTRVFEPVIDEALITCNPHNGSAPSEIRTYRARLVPYAAAADMEAYDGLYCLCTDVSEAKLSAEQAIQAYRKKNVVEEAFRVIKSEVKLRPVRVRAQTRVEGHVTVCVLAYFLLNALEEALKTSGSTHKQPVSALRKLAECTIDEYKFSGMAQPVRTLTKPTVEQMTILRDLGLEGIVSPRHMSPILKSQAYINPDPPADEAKPTV